MTTRPEVIAELRSLFKHGATPSRVIRHIVERHEGERSLYPLIQAYFHEAFGVPIVRGLSPVDSYDHADLRYAFLNDQLVHEMIQDHNQWETAAAEANGAVSWLEGLSATDAREQLRQVTTAPVSAELRRCWDIMTQRERDYIALMTASAKGLSEKVRALSNLAEALQLRINELEAASTPA